MPAQFQEGDVIVCLIQIQIAEILNMVREVIKTVYEALEEKGYNPVSQIIGYIMSGDPTYITSHKNARYLITRVERDELLEEILESYIDANFK